MYYFGEWRLESLGTHLLLDLEGCDPDLLDDLEFVRDVVVDAANTAGATIVGHTFHRFEPVGVTGIVAIAESHIGIHTWPEYAFAAADIFTCGQDFRPTDAANLVIERLRCVAPTITRIQRGHINRDRLDREAASALSSANAASASAVSI